MANILYIAIKIGSVFMDIYYLARLFRSLEWDKKMQIIYNLCR
jgi:hypothetical protein